MLYQVHLVELTTLVVIGTEERGTLDHYTTKEEIKGHPLGIIVN
jgi:hypothetical protein